MRVLFGGALLLALTGLCLWLLYKTLQARSEGWTPPSVTAPRQQQKAPAPPAICWRIMARRTSPDDGFPSDLEFMEPQLLGGEYDSKAECKAAIRAFRQIASKTTDRTYELTPVRRDRGYTGRI
jgi:hypothetical protein